MLKLVECRPGKPQIEKPIDPSNGPVTIGRGSVANIRVALGVNPSLLYVQTLSKIQATVYEKDGALFIKDGGTKPSSNGIYYKGRRTYAPIELYQGIEVELFPLAGGYHLYVAWPFKKEGIVEADTLIIERENLEIQLEGAGEEVTRLTLVVSDLETKLDKTVQASHTLNRRTQVIYEELRKQQESKKTLSKQLRLLKKLLIIFCVVSFIVAWLMLGGDQETLAVLGKAIISVASIIGFIFGIKPGDVDA
ncbi:FHA domain-containing protein [Leptolyngbya cf. ectocarpi LEGE 11479]|uniref:FHA domain-containing protein n=1 Tax=Leptolyngbya cf. ectocarpi LEGE 11479 TaxID=1828722 RepID=A0A928X258_LEPEC|nr:FHA domain-containing protein [Leptolyngbya ectocarpi]MBE9065138.1 FHA domain-containing protein [Leptolyngbya cf. ectocarpi LEGE 11479]